MVQETTVESPHIAVSHVGLRKRIANGGFESVRALSAEKHTNFPPNRCIFRKIAHFPSMLQCLVGWNGGSFTVNKGVGIYSCVA